MSDNGVKHDQEKVRLELLPIDPQLAIAEVLTYGAKKYAAWNWAKGFQWLRLYGAVQRHLLAWASGEDRDPETGFSHLAHAGCELFFLITHHRRGLGTDDRYTFPTPKPQAPPKSTMPVITVYREDLKQLIDREISKLLTQLNEDAPKAAEPPRYTGKEVFDAATEVLKGRFGALFEFTGQDIAGEIVGALAHNHAKAQKAEKK